MKAEYPRSQGFLQRDHVEHEEYAEARSAVLREGKERDGASDLLVLNRDNLNRAYKRVKRSHGAPGADGMTVEKALPWLWEHKEALLQSIREGKYMPAPVRRKEIPKPDDGGERKLGIPEDNACQFQIGLLAVSWQPGADAFHYKRKARTGGIL